MLLQQSPEGLFKRVEIGINNYDPHLFMNQAFTIYFFRSKHSRKSSSDLQEAATRIETEEEEEHKEYKPLGIMSEMPRAEYDVLMERIENDIVAFGEFQADEIV